MIKATHDVVGEDTQAALDIAASFIAAGVPIFSAPPCPAAHGGTCPRPGHAGGKEEYDLPPKWQLTVPSTVWLDKWQPGWALAAVGGHAGDFLDEDPRSGGEASIATLSASGHMPTVYGVQNTPSGGRHYLIAPLREHKATPATPDLPGLDYQGGAPDGGGRGFVWIAPTVRRSKNLDHMGERRAYTWAQPPDLDWLQDAGGVEGDGTGEMLTARIVAARAKKDRPRTDDRLPRQFTEDEAKRFVQPHLDKLMAAKIGGIEEAANAAATVLSRFVPGIWDANFAYDVLMAALHETAYDPEHPAAGWVADKFRDVISGANGRAPEGWRAERKAVPGEPVPPPALDAVEALLAEMKKPFELIDQPPQPYLIKELLNLESVAWMIGAPGSRKSFVALDMAGHVARGMPWQGLKVRQGRVVMIVAEGAGGIGGRLKAWEMEHGPLSDDIWILPRPVQSANPAAWQVLVEACRRIMPSLVIGDTQARLTVGLEENSATDMGLFVEALGAIQRATGACVMPIHHTGRNGGDARGSSALDGAQDTELKVVACAEPLRGELRVEKQKDLAEREPVKLVFRLHTVGVDEDGQKVTSLAVAGADAFLRAETAPDEPEEWERGQGVAQVQLIKVLRDQGGSIGSTKAEARVHMVERFYAGVGKPLARSTFSTAWTKVLEKRSASGEPVVTNTGGARWGVDEDALADLAPTPGVTA